MQRLPVLSELVKISSLFSLQSGSLVGSHPGFEDEERVEHIFPPQAFCVADTPKVHNSINFMAYTPKVENSIQAKHLVLRVSSFLGAVLMKRGRWKLKDRYQSLLVHPNISP